MKDLQPLLDLYDRGASPDEIRAEAQRLGITKEDCEQEAIVLEAFAAHARAEQKRLDEAPVLERIRLLVERIN